jgi:ubiquitin-conjugating enzyme E2 Z
MEEESKMVTRDALKRIISDVSSLVKNPLHDNGIYYEHDTENVLKGYVLIIPKDEKSPYCFGNYLFSLEFPTNYPYSPPKMNYLTNNGNTRFHPNLYRNGKVCLSILNTWKGEQWSSCNTLSSILLNITTLFTSEPLLHEPGITKTHESFNDYTTIIEYENLKTSIHDVLTDSKYVSYMNSSRESFRQVIHDEFKKNKNAILKIIEDKIKNESYENMEVEVEVPFYKMKSIIEYSNLYVKLKEYND